MALIKITVKDAFGFTPEIQAQDDKTLKTHKHEDVAASSVQVGDRLCIDHRRGICSAEVLAVETI